MQSAYMHYTLKILKQNIFNKSFHIATLFTITTTHRTDTQYIFTHNVHMYMCVIRVDKIIKLASMHTTARHTDHHTCPYLYTGKFWWGKTSNLVNCELYAKIFCANINIHRYTENVFGICTDWSIILYHTALATPAAAGLQ